MAEDQMAEIKTKFGGHWKLDRTENFGDFLKELGMNIFFRKMAGLSKPLSDFIVNGENITITMDIAGFIHKADTFQLGKEFETEFQGVRYKVITTYEDGQLKSVSIPKNNDKIKPQTTMRDIVNGEFYEEIRTGDVVCKRYFKRV